MISRLERPSAVLRRPRASRHPYFAVIDEFQEFLDTGRDMGAFFERSRSYGVGMCVATQSLHHPRLRNIVKSVLINTRTHVVFGGLRDQVRLFAMEMAPVFTPEDLDRRDAYQMAVATLVDNQPAPPFSARVAPIPPGNPERFERLRTRCQAWYGQPRAAIEAMVRERYAGLSGPPQPAGGGKPAAAPEAQPLQVEGDDTTTYGGEDSKVAPSDTESAS